MMLVTGVRDYIAIIIEQLMSAGISLPQTQNKGSNVFNSNKFYLLILALQLL